MILENLDQKTDLEILNEIMERNKEGLQRLAQEKGAAEKRREVEEL